MKKYYIGLAVIAALTLGLTIYVLMLGVGSRQDKQTEKRAQEIAEKLNNYISSENKIPADLKEIGVTDAPGTITYKTVGEEEYEFCVEYKAAKSYGGGDIANVVTGAALSRAYGGVGDFETSGDYKPSYLYLDYMHKKGKDCQTIKPYISSYNGFNSTLDDTFSDYCKPGHEYYDLYKSYCSESTNTENL